MSATGGPRAGRIWQAIDWRTVLGLLQACHPGPVAAVTAAAAGYGAAIGCSRRESARVALAILTGQLAIGWHNDWTDANRDQVARREDKPIANDEVSRRAVGRAAALAALCCVPASLRTGTRGGLVHLAAVASAASYNAGLKATPASFVPYAFSFALLPVVVHRASSEHQPPPWWAPATAGLLGVAAHILNVVPDREADRLLGVLGLPQRLTRSQDLALAGALLVGSSAIVSFAPHRAGPRDVIGFGASLALSATALRAARERDDRSAFRLVLVLAVFDVARLIASARSKAPMPSRGALAPQLRP